MSGKFNVGILMKRLWSCLKSGREYQKKLQVFPASAWERGHIFVFFHFQPWISASPKIFLQQEKTTK